MKIGAPKISLSKISSLAGGSRSWLYRSHGNVADHAGLKFQPVKGDIVPKGNITDTLLRKEDIYGNYPSSCLPGIEFRRWPGFYLTLPLQREVILIGTLTFASPPQR